MTKTEIELKDWIIDAYSSYPFSYYWLTEQAVDKHKFAVTKDMEIKTFFEHKAICIVTNWQGHDVFFHNITGAEKVYKLLKLWKDFHYSCNMEGEKKKTKKEEREIIKAGNWYILVQHRIMSLKGIGEISFHREDGCKYIMMYEHTEKMNWIYDTPKVVYKVQVTWDWEKIIKNIFEQIERIQAGNNNTNKK